MTKQPPFVTRLRLSRICRWLMALGLVKLCIFGALVAGYPLPELSLDTKTPENSVADATAVQTTSVTLGAPGDPNSPNAAAAATPGQAQTDASATVASIPQPAPLVMPKAAPKPDPQGSAAARAAAARSGPTPIPGLAPTPAPLMLAQADSLPATAPVLTEAPQATAPQTASPQGTVTQVVASVPVQYEGPATTGQPVADTVSVPSAVNHTDDKSWWSQVLQLKSLPFPRLGVDQVAHAATLDSPPSPNLPASSADNSPFAPPAQAIPRGQNPDGSPLAPRSTTAQPRPAGTSGPQFAPQENSIPAMLVPTDKPPTPRLDSYVPPEDPNRKQQELARREQEVLVLKQQMEQRLEELQNAERKVQALLDEAREEEAKKIGKLSSMYINMKPKQAAKALESMDERTAVKILAGMTPKQSGEILTYADPVKTAKLTELISRMRSGQ